MGAHQGRTSGGHGGAPAPPPKPQSGGGTRGLVPPLSSVPSAQAKTFAPPQPKMVGRPAKEESNGGRLIPHEIIRNSFKSAI